MPFDYGMVSEFSDPVSQRDPVVAVTGKVIELPRFKGVVWGMMRPPIVPITTKEFEIYSRSKTARKGKVGAGGWTAGATTDLPVDAASSKGLVLGLVLKVDSEIIRVVGVNQTANTIKAERGRAGTVAAAHAVDAEFSVLGYASKDTELKNVTSIQEKSLKYANFVQTIFEVLDYTKGATLKRKGLSDVQIASVLQREAGLRVAEYLSIGAVLGPKQDGEVNDGVFMSAGLLTQLADDNAGARPVLKYNANGTPLTEIKLKAALREAYTLGAPTVIVCSLDNKEKINDFRGALNDVGIQTDRNDKGRGVNVDYYDYEGARIDIRVDADMPNDKIAIVNPAALYKGWLEDDALKFGSEPSLSSRENREAFQGSVGFQVDGVGYEHQLIYNLTV